MEALPSLLQHKIPCSFRCSRELATQISATNYQKDDAKEAAFAVYGVQPSPLHSTARIGGTNARNEKPEVIRTLKLPSGVRIQEIIEGKGPEANEGNLVEINYVCRRSNGYFVHSTVDQFSGESSPVILPLDENEIIKGLTDVIIGMRVGGKRRALIPPSVGYVNENLKPIPEEVIAASVISKGKRRCCSP